MTSSPQRIYSNRLIKPNFVNLLIVASLDVVVATALRIFLFSKTSSNSVTPGINSMSFSKYSVPTLRAISNNSIRFSTSDSSLFKTLSTSLPEIPTTLPKTSPNLGTPYLAATSFQAFLHKNSVFNNKPSTSNIIIFGFFILYLLTIYICQMTFFQHQSTQI